MNREEIEILAQAVQQKFLELEETAGDVLLIMISPSEHWKTIGHNMEAPCVTISGNNTIPAIVTNITDWWNKGYFLLGTVKYEQTDTDYGQTFRFSSLAFEPEYQPVLDQMVTLITTDVTSTHIQ